MNVAASLSYMGLEFLNFTNVSNDIVGEAVLASLRKFGIDVSEIHKMDHPLGLYFMEVGSAMLSSKIVYNRLHSAFAHIEPDSVDWERILYCCDCLHWIGISPAISEGAYQTLKKGLELVQKKGITIAADPAYRSNLWQYGRKWKEVLAELVDFFTIFIVGVNEINEILNSDFGYDKRGFISASRALRNSHPSIEKVFD